jgi:enoyl-CoA hydratase
MTYEFLDVVNDGGVVTVTMNRPPVNAVTLQMYAELTEVFRSFEADATARVVVIASAVERAFCGGVDIKERATQLDEIELVPRKAAYDCYFAIYDCAVPVIAAVGGPALGAGIGIVASCDAIIASDKAVFGLPEITIGMLGGGAHLSRLIGAQRMRLAYYTGKRFSAQEFYDLGAIAKLAPHESLLAEAQATAREIAKNSPIAVRLAKQALNRVEFMPMREAYRLEVDYTQRLQGFQDTKEAMQAFLEKREPRFMGR